MLYALIFKWLGWQIKGSLPSEKKYLIVVAPHTSNWDFFIGLATRYILKFNPQFVAKEELFVWPLGWILKKLGGYGVERNKNKNFVQSVVDIFDKEDEFILTITPEGTRSYNDKWKTGFYFIALQAKVPILPVGFDYSTKTVFLGETLQPKHPEKVDEFVQDLKIWFKPFKGKFPEDGIR